MKRFGVTFLIGVSLILVGCGSQPSSVNKNTGTVKETSNTFYAVYTNERFHFRIEYPKSFVMEPPPTDRDGRSWHSQDNSASLKAFGSYNVLDDTVNSMLQSRLLNPTWEKPDLRPIITQHQSGSDWFTVYGYSDHSRKSVFGLKVYVGKLFEYEVDYTIRTNELAKYKPMMDHVMNSLVPGPLNESPSTLTANTVITVNVNNPTIPQLEKWINEGNVYTISDPLPDQPGRTVFLKLKQKTPHPITVLNQWSPQQFQVIAVLSDPESQFGASGTAWINDLSKKIHPLRLKARLELNVTTNWLPNHRTETIRKNGEDVVFVDAEHGWKMVLGQGPITSELVTVYRTTDGGKHWIKVATTDRNLNSLHENLSAGALPIIGTKYGLSFVNASTGWLSGVAQSNGFPYLYVTRDGGHTWQHQELPIPGDVNWYNQDMIGVIPPAFFTPNDGILIMTIAPTQGKAEPPFVIYYTHDGGAHWECGWNTMEIGNPPSMQIGVGSSGNLSWNFPAIPNRNQSPNGSVTVNGVTWHTTDGGYTWER